MVRVKIQTPDLELQTDILTVTPLRLTKIQFIHSLVLMMIMKKIIFLLTFSSFKADKTIFILNTSLKETLSILKICHMEYLV